jgi:hypothetical protein
MDYLAPGSLVKIDCRVLVVTEGDARTGYVGVLPGRRQEIDDSFENLGKGNARLFDQRGKAVEAIQLGHSLSWAGLLPLKARWISILCDRHTRAIDCMSHPFIPQKLQQRKGSKHSIRLVPQ